MHGAGPPQTAPLPQRSRTAATRPGHHHGLVLPHHPPSRPAPGPTQQHTTSQQQAPQPPAPRPTKDPASDRATGGGPGAAAGRAPARPGPAAQQAGPPDPRPAQEPRRARRRGGDPPPDDGGAGRSAARPPRRKGGHQRAGRGGEPPGHPRSSHPRPPAGRAASEHPGPLGRGAREKGPGLPGPAAYHKLLGGTAPLWGGGGQRAGQRRGRAACGGAPTRTRRPRRKGAESRPRPDDGQRRPGARQHRQVAAGPLGCGGWVDGWAWTREQAQAGRGWLLRCGSGAVVDLRCCHRGREGRFCPSRCCCAVRTSARA